MWSDPFSQSRTVRPTRSVLAAALIAAGVGTNQDFNVR